jgi:hypothetical protein
LFSSKIQPSELDKINRIDKIFYYFYPVNLVNPVYFMFGFGLEAQRLRPG